MLVITGLLLSSCACPSVPPSTTPRSSAEPDAAASRAPHSPLSLPAGSPFRGDPAMLERLRSSPHLYFRATNLVFAREVCRRFEPVMRSLPSVYLHGDVHLEQVAVTDEGMGLADFDDAVTGPPVIDLVRLGVSVSLAARRHGWGPGAADAVLDGYQQYMDAGSMPATPSALSRLRQQSDPTAAEFLAMAESAMVKPIPAHRQQEANESFAGYVALMMQVHPDHTEAFFRVKRRGQPGHMGIGSATTRRVFYRVEGSSDADDDDLVLEMKEMRDLSSVPCIEGRSGLSVRSVASAARFGVQPDAYLAVVPRTPGESMDETPWWIQSWWRSYAEVDIDTTFQSEADLREVAAFAAALLARGHTGSLPAPYDIQLRVILSNMLAEHRTLVETTIKELTASTLQGCAAIVPAQNQ